MELNTAGVCDENQTKDKYYNSLYHAICLQQKEIPEWKEIRLS
jgi:hypothetical protein